MGENQIGIILEQIKNWYNNKKEKNENPYTTSDANENEHKQETQKRWNTGIESLTQKREKCIPPRDPPQHKFPEEAAQEF